MKKPKREELRKYLQKLPSRTPLENVTTGDYVELLDALDEAERKLAEKDGKFWKTTDEMFKRGII